MNSPVEQQHFVLDREDDIVFEGKAPECVTYLKKRPHQWLTIVSWDELRNWQNRKAEREGCDVSLLYPQPCHLCDHSVESREECTPGICRWQGMRQSDDQKRSNESLRIVILEKRAEERKARAAVIKKRMMWGQLTLSGIMALGGIGVFWSALLGFLSPATLFAGILCLLISPLFAWDAITNRPTWE